MTGRTTVVEPWSLLDQRRRAGVIERANADGPHPYFTSADAVTEHAALFEGGGSVLAAHTSDRCVGVAGIIHRNLAETGELFLVGLRGEPDGTEVLVARAVAEGLSCGARTLRAGTTHPVGAPADALRGAGFREVDRAQILSLRGPGVGLGGEVALCPVEPADLEPWVALFHDAFAGTPNAARVNRDDVQASLERGTRVGFVEEHGHRLGVYELIEKQDHGWIDGIALVPRARGRGLGRRLLASAVRLLRAEGRPDEIRMLVMESNTAAMNLYRSAGFRTIEVRSVWFELTLG